MIPYGHQHISEADIDAVVEVLRSEYITQGPVVPRFERAVADRVGAQHSVAVNSATSALHIGCVALGLGAGDRLWTTANTFVASANCARYCGADVDFVDIDPLTWNLSVPALKTKLEQAKRIGALPKVVVPVHFAGQPTEQEAIWELAQEYGFRVLEDAAHSVGASRNGEPVGSCRWSDICVFSFHPVKIITTGEGGMALTNDERLAARLRLLRSHGITRDVSAMTCAPDGPWYYQQMELGYNYRMTDLQAALGLSQLQRLKAFVTVRQAIARRYDEGLADVPLVIPWQDPDNSSAFHLYVVRLKLDEIKSTHRAIFEAQRAAGIGVNLHYIPVYRHPYYARLGFKPGYCPEAEQYYAEAISLPIYSGLTEVQQDQVVAALKLACLA